MEVGQFTILDSITELNVVDWQQFNLHYMTYKEVGGSFQEYEIHHIKLNQLLAKNMIKEASIQLSNMRNCVFNSMNEYSPELEAFKCLIVGDKKGVENLSIGEIREAIEVVKKNSKMK